MVTIGKGRITVELATKGTLKGAQRQLRKTTRGLKRASAQTKKLSGNMTNLGSRLGFAAFQMTFLAGIAGRALGEIANQFKELIQVASKAEDTIIRAIAQSGIDISSSNSAEAVKFLNDAIRDLGSGRTLFSQEQVAEAAKEIGRAFTFAGSDMQKAGQLALVLKANLRLMTIEQIGAEESAIQLAKIMKQFGLNATQAEDAVNTLVLVNQQSSVTLQDLSKSMAAAGNFSREFGVDMNTLAAIMGVVSDRIGIRGSAAGRAFRRILENLSRTSTSLDPKLKALGISIRDDAGQTRNIVDILRDFKTALDKGGKSGSLIRQRILELGTASIRSRDALLALTQGFDQLEVSLKGLEEGADTAARLEQIFTATTEAKISRINNAINSLKIDLVSGLSPALTLILEDFRELILDIGVQEFFTNIGTAIGSELIPIVKRLSKLFTSFANVLKKNKLVIQLLTKSLVAFLTVITGLFIVTTLGALVLGLSAGFSILAKSQAIAILTTNALFISFLKFALFIGLAVVVVRSFVKILNTLKDGIQEGDAGIIAFEAALIGLGIAGIALIGKLGLIKAAIIGLGASLTGAAASLGAAGPLAGLGGSAGKGFRLNFIGGAKGIVPAMRGIISSLGRAGPIGLAIAAAIAIGLAFMIALNKQVDEDPFFKSGLADRWQVAGALMSIQVAVFLRDLRDAFLSSLNAILQFIEDFATRANEILTLVFEAVTTFPFDRKAARVALQKAIKLITKGLIIEDLDLDVNLQIKKERQIKTILETFGKNRNALDEQTLEAIRSISEIGGTPIDEKRLQELIKEQFGQDPLGIQKTLGLDVDLDPFAQTAQLTEFQIQQLNAELERITEELQQIRAGELLVNASTTELFEATGALKDRINEITELLPEEISIIDTETQEKMTKTLKDTEKSFKQTNIKTVDMNKTIGEVTKEVEKAIGVRIEESTAVVAEIDAIDENTGLLGINSKLVTEDSKKLVDETIEIVRNSNRLIDFTISIDRANIAFTKLAIEGTEAARRLSTLRVSKEGKFSISGRRTKTTFGEIGLLGQEVTKFTEVLAEDIKTLSKIDLKKLEEELKAITVFASEKIQKPGFETGGGGGPSTEEFLDPLNLNNLLQRAVGFIKTLETLTLTDDQIKLLLQKESGGVLLKDFLENVITSDLKAFIEQFIGREFTGLQAGGIVTRPTIAQLGERGPEAVVPLNKLDSLGTTVNEINITIEGSADETTVDDIGEIVVEALNKNIRRSGTVIR